LRGREEKKKGRKGKKKEINVKEEKN